MACNKVKTNNRLGSILAKPKGKSNMEWKKKMQEIKQDSHKGCN